MAQVVFRFSPHVEGVAVVKYDLKRVHELVESQRLQSPEQEDEQECIATIPLAACQHPIDESLPSDEPLASDEPLPTSSDESECELPRAVPAQLPRLLLPRRLSYEIRHCDYVFAVDPPEETPELEPPCAVRSTAGASRAARRRLRFCVASVVKARRPDPATKDARAKTSPSTSAQTHGHKMRTSRGISYFLKRLRLRRALSHAGAAEPAALQEESTQESAAPAAVEEQQSSRGLTRLAPMFMGLLGVLLAGLSCALAAYSEEIERYLQAGIACALACSEEIERHLRDGAQHVLEWCRRELSASVVVVQL
eukprot:1552687-Prymnesium_polylepis.1